jgi:hypothetical protein
LSSVSVALPDRAQVTFHAAAEPLWDSCDGRAGTFGWDDVSVDFELKTDQTPAAFVAGTAQALRGSGWNVEQLSDQGGPYLTGSRILDGTIPLKVVLSPSSQSAGGPVAWVLSASAPPSGPVATGC